MSRLGGRADRLYPGLSARERAVLVLQAHNADREPDPRIYWTMPDSQTTEFNGYMAQLRRITLHVGPYVLVLAEEISHARTKVVLLATLCSWGHDRSEFVHYIAGQTEEPCSQAEFEEHLAEARAQDLPLGLAVEAVIEAVIEARELWAEKPDEEPAAQLARYKQLAQPVEAEVRQLVSDGNVPGRGRGRALAVNAGEFHDWLGRPTPLRPQWGRGYQVVPEDELGWRREWRAKVRARVEAGPHSPVHVLEALTPSRAWLLRNEDLTEHDRLIRALGAGIRDELPRLAGSLGAAEVVIEETREAFNGLDPAPPILREVLESARAELASTCSLAEKLVGDLSLPETSDPVLEQLRGLPTPLPV